jgi:hypothetical protein
MVSWAGPRGTRGRKESRTRLRQPNSEGRKEQAGSGRPPSHLAAGKLFLFFYICFPNHLNRFSNPNQIKSKPHQTIKQMQQHEYVIKYST